MTSEPDSTRHRRPPTIDLTATEIEPPAGQNTAGATEPPGNNNGSAAAAASAANPVSPRRGWPQAAGAAAGAIVTAAIIGGLWLAGILPPSQPAAPVPAPVLAPPPANNAAIDAISARLDKIEAALRTPATDAALAGRLSAAEAQTKALGDSLAALNRRVDDIAVAAKSALAQANTATAAAEAAKSAAQGGVPQSDIDALNGRIAALERTVKSLSSDVAARPTGTGDQAARITIAAQALQAAVERGAPYAAELAAIKSLGAEQDATAPLEPFAAAGVPTAAALAHELSTLAPPPAKAAPQPGTAQGGAPQGGIAQGAQGFLERLEDHAQRLVRVTPVDAPARDDATPLVARIKADAAHADIAAALADIGRLPPAERAVFAPWVAKVNARNAAIAASRRLVEAALATLGKPASQ